MAYLSRKIASRVLYLSDSRKPLGVNVFQHSSRLNRIYTICAFIIYSFFFPYPNDLCQVTANRWIVVGQKDRHRSFLLDWCAPAICLCPVGQSDKTFEKVCNMIDADSWIISSVGKEKRKRKKRKKRNRILGKFHFHRFSFPRRSSSITTFSHYFRGTPRSFVRSRKVASTKRDDAFVNGRTR